MTKAEKARLLRPFIEKAAQSLNDEDALSAVELYENWEPNKQYAVDTKLRYESILYKVLQAHTSQAGWEPNVAVSLFARVLIPDPDVIPEWVQPDSTNAYMTGDRVRFEGNVYESLIDNNVWSPSAYPAGWKLINE